MAIFGKLVTGFTVFGLDKINRWAIGVGMIPRGEVGLVFAGVGAASGVISQATNAAIIMMVILTTFLAPPLLRVVFGSLDTVADESENAVLDTAVTNAVVVEVTQESKYN